MGTPGDQQSSRRGSQPLASGARRPGAGAACWASASSGGVLASFLLQQVGARRLPKNQGCKTSPRSAISADGEANTGTRSADPPARHGGRCRGLAQRPARHWRPQLPRKSGSPNGTWCHRGLCLVAGSVRPRTTTPCPSDCAGVRHRHWFLRTNFLFYFSRFLHPMTLPHPLG